MNRGRRITQMALQSILSQETADSNAVQVLQEHNIIPNDCEKPECSYTSTNKEVPVEDLHSNKNLSDDESPHDFSDSGSEYKPSETDLDINESTTAVTESAESSYEILLDPSTGQITHVPKEDGRKKKRKSKGQGDPSNWKRKQNFTKRLRGESYYGFQKDEFGKYKQTALKPAKVLKPACKGHSKVGRGGPQQNFECELLTQVNRESIFQYFWNLNSWEARKVYVRNLITVQQPRYRRKDTVIDDARKGRSFMYYLSIQTNEATQRFHVCKTMFTSTLNVGVRLIRDWILKDNIENSIGSKSGTEKSERHVNVQSFLNSLPKVESHYCRSSSTKLYLEPIWQSYRHLYSKYKENCTRDNKTSCSWRYFMKIFRQLNLDIYSPRKDQCDTCSAYKKGNKNQLDYDAHQLKKNKARDEKATDKNSSNINVLVYTMDVQAVLLCPRLQASGQYYKTKLKVHNYTIFNLKNKDAACYIWHEGQGGLDSDVFTSVLIKHLKNEITETKPQKIILWSDGCCYQNRCQNMSNGLLELAVVENIIIEQKYLEVGHTQMEVDSIHSSIEKKLPRRREVFVPADYINIIRSARQHPFPYRVYSLTYKDFKNYSNGQYNSIRPGNKTGDPMVTDIVALQYLPEGKIRYKLDFNDNWTYLPRRPNPNRRATEAALYESTREIETTKFVHLQEMKPLIPADHHCFYDNLKHKCSDSECSHIRYV